MEFITQYATLLIGLGILVVLLLIGILVYRQLNQRIRGRRGSRLAVSEFYELDQTRRLVLVKRDGVEHLVLIGGPADVVIESGIGARPVPADMEERRSSASTIPLRPSPRPPVFGENRPALRPVAREEPVLNTPRPYSNED
ncbi:MAG: hypothetical protein ACKVP5_05755 [Aestuariivirga sp.]